MEEVSDFNNIHFFDTLESTNLYAQERIKSKKITTNCVIVAKHQTVGKGQRGSRWSSNYGENMLISFVLFPEFLMVEDAFYLSKITSLALFDFVCSMTEGQVKIKWPNDLYVQNKKIAGILIENNIIGSKISSSVLGIGLNVNQMEFDQNLNATSLSLENKKKYQLTELPFGLLKHFESRWKELQNSERQKIDSDYLSRLYAFGENKLFEDENGDFKGRIVGLAQNGLLKVHKDNGTTQLYDIKELKFL